MLIGLDFDNTLADYDSAFVEAARARGLVAGEFSGGKVAVRDHIRQDAAGDLAWQALQGYVYGAGIGAAKLFEGVREFLHEARSRGARVVIVSHKTEFGHFDVDRVNLREAALDWMRRCGLLGTDGLGIAEEDVQFAATREEKIAKIIALAPDVFVDDLPEVLTALPSGITRILFGEARVDRASIAVAPHWHAVTKIVFPV